jgi:periplasmic protein TonB
METKKSPKANLENKRLIFSQIGMVIALALVFFAFEYRTYEVRSLELPKRTGSETDFDLIPITKHKQPEPPLPKQSLKITPIEDHKQADDPVIIDASITPDVPIPPFVPTLKQEDQLVDDTPVAIPEAMPEFPGGTEALMAFLAREIKYPPLAREMNITGTVYLGFVIERDGSISGIKLLRGIGGGCDQEAMRVVSLLPAWKPGMQAGQPVRVTYNLPVKFILQ